MEKVDFANLRETPLWIQMTSASVSSCAVSVLMTPFDFIKTRTQAFATKQPSPCFRCMSTNSLGTLRSVIVKEGPTVLWTGLPLTLVIGVPSVTVYYSAYERFKFYFAFSGGYNSFYSPMLAGACARLFASTLISPLELVRTLIQAREQLSYSTLFRIVRYSVQLEGILVLWKGWLPTMVRDVPFSMTYWALYEQCKTLEHGYSVPISAVIGGSIAGCVAATVTCPFDVIKTGMQNKIGEPGSGRHEFLNMIKSIHLSNGFRGYFAGLAPRLAKVTPACALMIGLYEQVKSSLTAAVHD